MGPEVVYLQVRPGAEADLDAIVEIYNHYVRETAITFDTACVTPVDRLPWLRSHPEDGPHRLLVAHEPTAAPLTSSPASISGLVPAVGLTATTHPASVTGAALFAGVAPVAGAASVTGAGSVTEAASAVGPASATGPASITGASGAATPPDGSPGRVLGWATSSPFRARAAYATSVEVSVYCAADAAGRGIGSLLYESLFKALEGEDLHRAYAGITQPNEASTRLHTKFGFQHLGTYREVGRKFGRYWDVAWYEKPLGAA